MGSTRAARIAGNSEASAATPSTIHTTVDNLDGKPVRRLTLATFRRAVGD
jgi:hypothetical protein